uniref:Flagellar and Swarming motility protein n=1 Tax=Siphoviridae sp. ctnR613 TaxID=2827939 RepID=A0A8S5SNM3_9CAUD|nr:MAG TPA: Flagellar and Swarming motility protein [Siphoviridae sp. ctnR613]
MENFIKVTVDCGKGAYDCYVNIHNILCFAKERSDCNCLIYLANGDVIFTITTMQEIKRLIEEKQQHKGE